MCHTIPYHTIMLKNGFDISTLNQVQFNKMSKKSAMIAFHVSKLIPQISASLANIGLPRYSVVELILGK